MTSKVPFNLPKFFLVGARPAKAVATADGGMDVLAYDFSTGEIVRDMGLVTRLFTPDDDVDPISEADFDRLVADLRSSKAREVKR